MALVFGFDGAMTEERVSQWSRLIAGLDVTVGGWNDWEPSVVAGQDRIVSVGPGVGWGYGITIDSALSETVQLTPVASGVRHDLICWKLDWTPQGGTVELVAIPGTATEAIPATPQNPGRTIAYVRVCLAKVTAGVQAPAIVRDLRKWGAQPLYAASLLAIDSPRPGQQVTLTNGETWRRVGSEWVKATDQKPQKWTGYSNNWASGFQVRDGIYLNPWWDAKSMHGPNTLALPGFGHGRVMPAGRYTIDVFVPVSPYLGSLIWELMVNPTGLTGYTSQTAEIGGTSLGVFQNGTSKNFVLTRSSAVTLTGSKGTNNADVPTLYIGGNYVDITRWGDA